MEGSTASTGTTDTQPAEATDESIAAQQLHDEAARSAWIAGIAQVTHEANRAYCLSIGDASQPHWEDAPDWQRESAIAGVQDVVNGTARSPEEQHERWCQFKLDDGWTFGPEKDAEKKTHPCLVTYAQLPEEQKRKDFLFRAVVAALAGEISVEEIRERDDTLTLEHIDALGRGGSISHDETSTTVAGWRNGARVYGHGANTAAALADFTAKAGE